MPHKTLNIPERKAQFPSKTNPTKLRTEAFNPGLVRTEHQNIPSPISPVCSLPVVVDLSFLCFPLVYVQPRILVSFQLDFNVF